MAKQKILRYDYDVVSEDGSDNLTATLMDLLNEYPLLPTAQVIEFQLLDTTKGIAMFPNPSVAILTEETDVTGHVTQNCAYAFTVVYRTRATSGKEKVKEWLDNLGRWLEQQEISGYKIEKYPKLKGDMEFQKIARTTQSYLYGNTEDKAEDWAISLQATYRNEYDK